MGSRKKSHMQKREPRRLAESTRPSSGRRWLFRVIALTIVPLLFFLLVEIGLRVAGFGYETGFLIKQQRDGEQIFVSNPRFGWRYFGQKLARMPVAFSVAAEKPENTIRIIVFGESAAYGDPNPSFGLPRMLETTLRLRHPGRDFEIINAAMTGINSHAVREIASDCIKADADAWVIYMGNNEVVGPFGRVVLTLPAGVVHASACAISCDCPWVGVRLGTPRQSGKANAVR